MTDVVRDKRSSDDGYNRDKSSISASIDSLPEKIEEVEPEMSDLEVEQDEEEDDEEGETRCICGELDTPDDSGFFIQCDNCSVWQHGYCVGINEGDKNAPEKYMCEQCRPDLHDIYTTAKGEVKSTYKPVQQTRKRPGKRGGRHRKEQALSQISGSNNSPEASKIVEQHLSNEVSTAVQEATEMSALQNDEEHDMVVLQDRKRATSMAREEKHYQWMLEKAIKESQAESKTDSDGREIKDDDNGDQDQLGEIQDQIVKQPTGSSEPSNIQSHPKNTSSDESSRKNSSEASAASSADPPKVPAVTKPLGRRPGRGGRRGPRRKPGPRPGARAERRANNNSDRTSNGHDSKTEVGIDKPVRPRIPPQKTTLNEMKRRVAAILEFISRTQYELSEEKTTRDDLVRFVDNREFVNQVDSIFLDYDQSLAMMDDLTRKLLLWERKYATAN